MTNTTQPAGKGRYMTQHPTPKLQASIWRPRKVPGSIHLDRHGMGTQSSDGAPITHSSELLHAQESLRSRTFFLSFFSAHDTIESRSTRSDNPPHSLDEPPCRQLRYRRWPDTRWATTKIGVGAPSVQLQRRPDACMSRKGYPT